MGNLSFCKQERGKKKNGMLSRSASMITNELMQAVTIENDTFRVELYNGYCSSERADATINVTDERISQNQSEQERMLFKLAGNSLAQETKEFLANNNNKLDFKFPFYTHAGFLPISNIIHCTLSDNTKTISDTLIIQTFMDCLAIADTELEAHSITIPMINLRSLSLARISRLICRAIKNYSKRVNSAAAAAAAAAITSSANQSNVESAACPVQEQYQEQEHHFEYSHHHHNQQQQKSHLKLIKLIGDDPKLYTTYMAASRQIFISSTKSICLFESTEREQLAKQSLGSFNNDEYPRLRASLSDNNNNGSCFDSSISVENEDTTTQNIHTQTAA